MKHEISVLVISPNKSLFRSVSQAVASIGSNIKVHHTSNVREAILLLNQIGIKPDTLQIYLDSTCSSVEANKFVRLLDQDFRRSSRNSVVLIDDASSVSGIVRLAMARCVWDVLNLPVLPIEVETAIRKRFRQNHSAAQSNSVV
ncbi:hypothetical protein O3Q51_06725 [Cryomorphaceae bacterium 1068]|nr:hypothetical protein [Cryomorphaceae bacterium 1068]